MGLLNTTRNLASLWVQQKKRQLEHATPNTKIDSGGSQNNHSWTEQSHERGKLREVKEIRDSGGIVARLLHWKALVFFGTGVEVNTQDNEDLKEWIRQDAFPNLDTLLTELGEDSLWFPYALGETVETRGGGFSHYEPVEPWTTLPVEDEYGKIVAWEQEIQGDYGTTTETYEPDDLQSFIVNKSSARDNTGISDVIRAEGTIDQFYENRDAAQNAMDQAGFRRLISKVGREDGGVIDDNELRRVRNRINNLKEDTVLVTGPHVEFDLLDAMDPGKFKEMREMDLRDLCLALGVPIEFASVISEGLGSGEQSGLRERAFILEGKAAQRLLGGQFTEQVLRPVVEEYSPYEADDLLGVTFGEPVPDEPGLNEQAPYLKTNEIREKLDKPPEEDEEIGESYQEPAQVEAPDDEGIDQPGGGAGFFSDGRSLQVPDNATSIDSPDECNGSVIEGPQGGMYCVPEGDGGDTDDSGVTDIRGGDPPESVDLSDEVDSKSLDDAGITDGSNHGDMRIAQLDNGSEVFVRENVDDFTSDRIAAGQSIYDQVGVEMPDQHISDDGTLAKEAIDGETLRDGVEGDVNEESVVDAYAAAIITGDTDMHGGNMMVREDGTAVPIDIAGSGGPVDSASDKEAKVMNYVEQMGLDIEFSEIENRVEEMAQEVDPDEIPDGVATDNIKDNVEALA